MPKYTPCKATRTDGTLVGEWLTAKDAGEAVGCSPTGISYALRFGLPAAGYLWSRSDIKPEGYRCARCKVILGEGAFRWFASPISGNPVRRCYCRECESRKAVERARRNK